MRRGIRAIGRQVKEGRPLREAYVAGDLADAMRKNPGLRVFSVNGYFDLATPFFMTEYDLSHMELEPKLSQQCPVCLLSFGPHDLFERGCAEGDACGFGGMVSDGGEVGRCQLLVVSC